MGKRSDRRKFRRRRRWAGFLLLVSLGLVVFGAQFLMGIGSPDLQPAASRTAERVGVERVNSPDVAGAPEPVGKQTADEVALLASEEEDVKTPAEKKEVDREAARLGNDEGTRRRISSHNALRDRAAASLATVDSATLLPQDGRALGSEMVEEVLCAQDASQRLAQVDVVDEVAASVDERRHLRIPPRHAASEVHTCIDELLTGDLVHGNG